VLQDTHQERESIMSNSLGDLLRRMPEIAEAVNSFASPEVQMRAFDALISAAQVDGQVSLGGTASSEASTNRQSTAKKLATKKAAPKASKKSTSNKKQTLSLDKNLDLNSPSPNWQAFAAEKAPSNQEEKVVVAVYWLENHSATDKVNVNQVYTCFKDRSWVIPADLANAAQRAGSAGLLHSADRNDLSVTTSGENRVEQDLPKS